MKDFYFYALSILFLIVNPLSLLSEDEPAPCPTNVSELGFNEIPNYLQPWWGHVETGLFAVVFVDFPDGRYINGNDTLQPFYDWQLEWVYSNGQIDAAAEMGLVLEQTNIPTLFGNKYVKASKYNWYDRWNMFFDSVGAYVGAVHPDWTSNGDSAWGSFKEYWKQASNSKFELIPGVTRPNETNYKLRTGIINDYVMINGQPVIKSIKLPKKKYGVSAQDSYFLNDSTPTNNIPNGLSHDAETAIMEQTEFDPIAFQNSGGIIFIYFAGTHRTFIDGTNLARISPIRSRENNILHPESKMDGFGVSCHQYGHMKFGWAHTRSGRCDIMNGHDVHDNNSPQFPNPIFRVKEGWLQPIALDNVSLDTLPPVETSYKCGVVTVFGKPNASPDWSTGESFLILKIFFRIIFIESIKIF